MQDGLTIYIKVITRGMGSSYKKIIEKTAREVLRAR